VTLPPIELLPGAGWYPDPAGRAEHRWWDGASWTTSIASGSVASIDLLGLPIALPPGEPATPPEQLGTRAADGDPNAPRPWLLAALAVAIVVVLTAALALVVHAGNDRSADDAAARSALSDQVNGLRDHVSELSSRVDELSSDGDNSFSDFSSFSFSDILPTVDACTLLTVDDIRAALGIETTVDPTSSFGGYLCIYATADTANGTAVAVRADQLFGGDVIDQLQSRPGSSAPNQVAAGDIGYVVSDFGQVTGVAAKGDQYVEVDVETAGTAPTVEQMTALLQAAVARL
jgi:hypothetical protein